MIRCSSSSWPVAVVGLLAALLGGCKPEEPTCKPDQIKWGLQLALQSGDVINPTDDGQSLPTVVRVFQMRGDIAIEDLDFEALWKVEKADELGESFLSMEELTMFPAKGELRNLPVEPEATHVLAAALFRKPASDTWYTSYELPNNHGDVVCAKAPDSKQYPEPCFYVRLDRNALEGGATPPAGFEVDGSLQCAPLGVVLAPPEEDDEKKKRKERRKKRRNPEALETDDLQKRLDGAADDVPEVPKTPKTPEVPNPELPKAPKVPDVPKPEVPKAPEVPKPRR